MRTFNGPNPNDFGWRCSEAKFSQRDHWTDLLERIPETVEITAWNLPRENERYADPDIRIRCYVHDMHNGKRWCEVYVAQGVTAGLQNPNPRLYHHNAAAIEDAYTEAVGKCFPADIRLYMNGNEWIQIGEIATV